jgi:hypothetical protein
MTETDRDYIGDGVYVSSEGWQIWVRTQREIGVHEIALEPPAFEALVRYARRIWGPKTEDAA